MTIHWQNILVLLLAITAVILLLHFREPIGAFVGSIGAIGTGPRDQELVGLLALGFIAAIALAALRILLHDRRNKP